MEENWRHRSLLDDRCRKNRDSPSFSSTLLDAIYRSIDEGGGQEEADKGLELYKQAMRKKHPQQHRHINNNSNCSAAVRGNAAAEAEEETEKGSLRRAILIEKWLQKKEVVTSPATAAAAVDFEKTDARRRRGSCRDEYSPLVHSSSSSSDSSCGGGFSSSEAESIHGVSDLHGALKPVRTRTRTSTTTTATIVSTRINGSESHRSYTHHDHHQKSATPVRPKKNEGAFSKTKSKVPLKMYGDLKTAKQPISPGARLAGFLNSLLPAKKPKTTLPSSSLRNVNGDADPNPERKSKHSAPACSSASSFSRSCLSLTPSAREKLGSRGAGTGKISVRLGPASPTPVVDQDPSARGHKKVYGIRPSFAAAVSKAARDSSAVANNNHKLVNRHDAEDVLKACHRRHHHYHHQKLNKKDDELSIKPESDLEDGVSSCSSLDLFELDHLSAIGMHRYREELPVD